MFRSYCLFLITALLLAGCATVPKDYPRTESTAFQNYRDTSGGQLFEEAAAQHPGESGFTIITEGRRAFTARVALVDLAEKTLDAQYYIWEADGTGWILAERLADFERTLMRNVPQARQAMRKLLWDERGEFTPLVFTPADVYGEKTFDFSGPINIGRLYNIGAPETI